jgi:hypothetical protein
MARNNRDRLIETFIGRNRQNRRKPGPPGYRPVKQGTVAPYRPGKRSQRPARY